MKMSAIRPPLPRRVLAPALCVPGILLGACERGGKMTAVTDAWVWEISLCMLWLSSGRGRAFPLRGARAGWGWMTVLWARSGGVGSVGGDRRWREQRNGATGGEPGADEPGQARRSTARKCCGKFTPSAERGEELRGADENEVAHRALDFIEADVGAAALTIAALATQCEPQQQSQQP